MRLFRWNGIDESMCRIPGEYVYNACAGCVLSELMLMINRSCNLCFGCSKRCFLRKKLSFLIFCRISDFILVIRIKKTLYLQCKYNLMSQRKTFTGTEISYIIYIRCENLAIDSLFIENQTQIPQHDVFCDVRNY